MKAKLLLLMVSVGLCLAAVESYARFYNLAPKVYSIQPGREKSSFQISDNPVLGYEGKPNYKDIRADHWESFPSLNSEGLRDIERTVSAKPGVRRILLLGDSVVQGLGIHDQEDTITRNMERLLRDKNIEVLNFGVTGYNTRQEVELLKTKGLQYRPDLVVLLFTSNDFDDFNGNVWAYSFNRPWFTEFLFLHSSFFRWVSLHFNWFHFRAEIDPDYQKNWQLKASGSNNVQVGLTLLKQLEKEHGFETLIVSFPQFKEEGVIYPDLVYLNKSASDVFKVEQYASELSFTTARLKEFYDKDYRSRAAELAAEGRSRLNFYALDGMHPNNDSSVVTAKAIIDAIERKTDFLP